MTTPAPWQRWLRQITHPSSPRWRLFCFPPAAAGASYFRRWVDVPDELELWAVQPPGREDRHSEEGREDIKSMAAEIALALQWFSGSPFAFFGHSMGALVAYETTLRLHEQGMSTPAHVFASSCAAPRIHVARTFRDSSDDEVESILLRQGMPNSALSDVEFRSMILSTARLDLTAFFEYRPNEALLPCPITCLRGLDDSSVQWSDVKNWQYHSKEPVVQLAFPGSHHYLKDNAEELLDGIVAVLDSSGTR
ncbi:thioesterase II family protein [Streptomyces sp. NPDC087908]|uniref:thioesterase II family protein n=1 Tax=Streptomyces sp. NPDC087908 TaxID=3365820 RepID=UPI0038289925